MVENGSPSSSNNIEPVYSLALKSSSTSMKYEPVIVSEDPNLAKNSVSESPQDGENPSGRISSVLKSYTVDPVFNNSILISEAASPA